MKQRCYDLKAKGYKYYGGKGVTIYEEWLNDRNEFYKWALENGYKDNLSIDRIKVDGNYEPDNCRWITMKEQQSNRTDNVFYEYNGETKIISQWADETGIADKTLHTRIIKGKENIFEDSLIKVDVNGEIKTLKQISEESGIAYPTIHQRYHYGWNSEDLYNDLSNETKYIEINGEIHNVRELAEMSGLSKETILMRISYGWKNEDLLKPLQKPGRHKRYVEVNGEFYTIIECCKIAGISRTALYNRIKKGWKGQELLAKTK